MSLIVKSMLTKNQLDEIRGYLDKAENPLIFFDEDPDGLCSYLLLKKYMDKGKGFVVKRSKEMGEFYLRKVKEYSPDVIFILDIFDVSQDFIDKINVPIIWIDHHPIVNRKGVKYFNPKLKDKNDNRPTTYWCYKITKKNLWLATVGCISDWFVPEFSKDFVKKYPDLLDKNIKDPAEANFKQPIGELIKIFHFILKGKASDAIKNSNILVRIENPYEILRQETSKGKFIYKYAKKLGKSYDSILERALEVKPEGKLHLFIYPHNTISYTSYLANNVSALLKDKFVIIAREHLGEMKMSLRSGKIEVLPILKNVLKKVNGYGGGHLLAAGANVKKEDFEKFINEVKKELNK